MQHVLTCPRVICQSVGLHHSLAMTSSDVQAKMLRLTGTSSWIHPACQPDVDAQWGRDHVTRFEVSQRPFYYGSGKAFRIRHMNRPYADTGRRMTSQPPPLKKYERG